MVSSLYDKIADNYGEYIVNTYGPRLLDIKSGKGVYVYDYDSNEYLDFLSGISVNCLGYAHPEVIKRIKFESEKLHHTSNLFYTENQVELAKKIIDNSFNGKCFFCNSGTEANEAALKIIKKYGNDHGEKREIISFKNSFHGRTIGSLSVTGQTKYHTGFTPLLTDIKFADFNDYNSFLNQVSENTAGVILELIQAEGGINTADEIFIKQIYNYCLENDILLAIDEVQTGIGRTGEKFCFQHYGIEPDIMTLAKGLGAGLPIGLAVIGERCKYVLQPGMHASTFGGNSLITGVANLVIDTIFTKDFLNQINKTSKFIFNLLTNFSNKTGLIKNIRGKGLLIGFDVETDNKKVVKECLNNGLIINAISEKSIRLAPPLIIQEAEAEKGLNILFEVLTVKK